MMEEPTIEQLINDLESRIADLNVNIEKESFEIRQWTDANKNLSLNAATARAKNQSMGRGVMGSLLGSKYRSTMRSAAASSNAAISKEVAKKRKKISDGKQRAQMRLQAFREELLEAKADLKELKQTKVNEQKLTKREAIITSDSLDLLEKLKEVYDAGLLTEEEYEEKRKNLVARIQ